MKHQLSVLALVLFVIGALVPNHLETQRELQVAFIF